MVPANAEMPSLALPGAARRELTRFDPQIGASPLGPWAYLPGPPHWDTASWLQPLISDDGPGFVGVPFNAIEGLAGWGVPPASAGAMLLSDPQDGAAIEAFLEQRGYQSRDIDGSRAWWLDDEDFRMDLTRRSGDAFIGPMGQAARVTVSGSGVLSAHGWPPLQAALAAGDGLLGDGGKAGIIDAAEAAEAGTPVEMTFTGPQTPRLADPGASVAADPRLKAFAEAVQGLPPVSSYADSALVLWQDGERMTAGVALFYGTSDGAEAALPWFTALAASPLAAVDGWADLLARTTSRSLKVGSGSVLLWTVEAKADQTSGATPTVRLPGPLNRMLGLAESRELGELLGG